MIQDRLGMKSDKLQKTIEGFSRKETIQDRQLRAHIDQVVKVQSDRVRFDLGS